MNIWLLGNIIFSLISPISYSKSMMHHKAKPHRVTRLIVWFASIAGVLGVLHTANYAAFIFAFLFYLRASYILLMSLKYGTAGSTTLDKSCLTIGILALILYFITGNGLLTILLGISADLIGFIPTYVKTYNKPFSEDPVFFIIECVASLFGLIAIGSFQIGILFPFYMLICDLFVLALIYRQKLMSNIRPYFNIRFSKIISLYGTKA